MTMKNSGKASGLFERTCAATKLALALLLVMTMVVYVPPSPSQAYAANGPVGTIKVDGVSTGYSTYAELAHDLENLANKEVTIDMARDWRKLDATNGFARLVIPVGSNVTLNMNGHMINKMGAEALADMKEESGEVILVMNGANLTVNGGTNSIEHSVRYYKSTDENQRSTTETRSGGVITGGSSTSGGGGIVIREGGTVNLYDVTIAGCRARRFNEANGDGGGVYVDGNAVYLNMFNSTIEGCYAGRYGGGVFVPEGNEAIIKLYGSHIDNNRARSAGGGIEIEGRGTRVLGIKLYEYKTWSTVSGNESFIGGGIASEAGGVRINEIEMKGNKAHRGGAMWISRDPFGLEDLLIEDNEAVASGSERGEGGGIYIKQSSLVGADEPYENMQCSVVKNCTVQGNKANRYAGIFFDEHLGASDTKKWERKLLGTMIVEGNVSSDNPDCSNLCIVADEGPEENDWVRKSVTFHLDPESDVHVGFATNSNSSFSTEVFFDDNCADCLKSDHGAYKFEYVTYTEGDEEVAPIVNRVAGETAFTKVPVTAANANNASAKGETASKTVAGKVGTVGNGGAPGSDYDLIRGFYMHDHETNLAAFYYSDGLFYGDPYTYNTHLGTASWNLAFVGGYLDDDKNKELAWSDGNVYYNKHAAARQFFADIGCPDQNIYVNDSMIVQPGTDTIGVSIASKELRYASTVGNDGKLVPGEKTGDILIPVTVRGLGYEAEWVSNVTLGKATDVEGAEAKGFSDAATKVMTEIDYYLYKYGLEDAFKEGRVKFWVTGFSRAGATANLVSKRLVDKIAKECKGEKKSQVFAYPCEAPKGGTDLAEIEGNNYFCIHNMVNMVDLVPYVAPVQMGFKRYGVDHYIPGGPAGEVATTVTPVTRGGEGGPTQATTYADNEAYLTKTDPYNQQKAIMLDQLKAMDTGATFNDYFIPMAMDFVNVDIKMWYKPWDIDLDFMKIYSNGTISNQVEYFSPDVLRLAIEGVYPNQMYGVGKAAATRDVYASDGFTLQGNTYPSIQTAAKSAVKLLMTDNTGFMNKAGNIMDQISYFDLSLNNLTAVYLDLIGKWDKLGDSWRKKKAIDSFWSDLEKTGALNGLSASDRQQFEECFPTLLNVAFNFVDADYLHHPKDNSEGYQWAKGSTETMMTVPTLMTYRSYILGCHMPSLNIAWTRSYDSWYMYNDEYSEYVLERPGSVKAPEAYGSTVAGEQVALESGSGKNNSLTGDQTIILENPEIAGEAVYYKLQGGDSNSGDQLYRGGIHLALGDRNEATYTITAYTFSYGVKSAEVTYNITLGTNNHKVIVKDLDPAESGGSSDDSSGTASGASTATVPTSGGDGLSLMAGSIADPSILSGAASENASGQSENTRSQEFFFEEGRIAFVEAGVPDSKYFKNWKVTLSEDGSDDLAASLTWGKGGEATKPAAFFTMPSTGDTFPANYSLVLDAQYGDRLGTLAATVSFPVAGGTLSSGMTVGTQQFPIEWTYADSAGKEVLTSGDAYNETIYTAKVTVPQNMANGLMFMKNVAVTVSDGGGSGKSASANCTRSDTDGSITFKVTFPTTGTGGASRPDVSMGLNVEAFDLNANVIDPDVPTMSYSVHPSQTVAITAPDVPGEAFVGWKLDDESTTLAGSRMVLAEGSNAEDKTIEAIAPSSAEDGAGTIRALYVPVVEKIDVRIHDRNDEAFVMQGGATAPQECTMSVTIANEYEIDPQNLKLSWSPEPKASMSGGSFAYNTAYVATAQIVPSDSDGMVHVRPKGSTEAYSAIAFTFLPSENLAISFNGDSSNTSYDIEGMSVSKGYPQTSTNYILEKVKQPSNIEGVEYGTDANGISGLLPRTTKVLTKGGYEFDAVIEWGTPADVTGTDDPYAERVWAVQGTVQLPDGVSQPSANPIDLTVKLTASVDAAETALMPSMTLPDGVYLTDQWSMLTTNEEGGTTYFTTSQKGAGDLVIEDPTDPNAARAELTDDNNTFSISRLRALPTTTEGFDEDDDPIEVDVKSIIVKAYTEASGKRPSDVVTFEYQFRDIPVPEGQNSEYDGKEHIGVQAGPYYTLHVDPGSNARVDEYGNVVATVPGTYTVTAELALGNDYWEADDQSARSHEDKTVEFTIAGTIPSHTSVYKLDIVTSPTEGGTVAGAGTYVDGMYVSAKAWANEGFGFVDWTLVSDDPELNGTVASDDFAYTFPLEGDLKLQANFARHLTVRWLDADGNEIDSKTYLEGEEEPTTEAKPDKQADAMYAYTFEGWSLVADDDDAVKTYEPRFMKTLNKYAVSFVNHDGTVLQKDELAYGETPAYKGGTPAKPATAQYTYAFAGWTPEIDKVSDDATYTATYTNTLRKYTVAFVNDDGTVLQESEFVYGETPEYTGATPTKAATAELIYTFKGWDQEITTVTGDATYKATYAEVPYTDKYYCAEGFGATWMKGSGDSLRFTFKRIEDDDQTFNRFAGIQVDGQSVAEGTSNYIVAKGSAIILLQPSYLETLSVGQHVMKAVFDDGEAQASFEVKAGSSNSDNADSGSAGSSSAATKPSSSGAAKTGDPLAALPAIAVTLAVASACCLVFVGYARRRRE